MVFITMGVSFSLYILFLKEDSTVITQEEATAIATNLYGGEVLDAELDENKSNYQIQLENDKGTYHLMVDSITKKISDIKLVKRKETIITLEEAKENIEKELRGKITQINQITKEGQPLIKATIERNSKQYRVEYDVNKKSIISKQELTIRSKPSPSISELEAKEIALKQIEGEVTNISIVKVQNGKHYKVTVDDRAEGAHVYVQANTGNVSSISWYSTTNDDEDDLKDDIEDDDHDDDMDDNVIDD
jgi:uncharacterized membrane protein YkoI